MTASDTVIHFVEHLNAMRFDDAFALLDPDIVYHNIPLNPVRGHAGVQAMFDHIDCEAMDWIIHACAESVAPDGHAQVLVERTDRFRLKVGRWIEIRLMGNFEVVDGRITAWRDYFDLAQWTAQMAPPA